MPDSVAPATEEEGKNEGGGGAEEISRSGYEV